LVRTFSCVQGFAPVWSCVKPTVLEVSFFRGLHDPFIDTFVHSMSDLCFRVCAMHFPKRHEFLCIVELRVSLHH
jgi:hypothetical protein